MALIKCSNCGQLVSDKARKCPKCGTEIHRIDVQNERNQSQTNSNDAEHEKNSMQPNTSFQQQDMGYQQPNMGYQQSPRIKSEYSMSFTDAISICLGNFSNFEERSRRKEYWYFMIFIYLINICIFLIQALIINSPGNHQEQIQIIGWIYIIFNLVFLIPSLAVFWRRMHDIGKSGAWFFINLIPIIGSIISIIYLCEEGDIGENEYGDDPKYEIE